MTHDEARRLIFKVIRDVAPNADLATLKGGEDMRVALDLDSMDFLNVLAGIHEQSGIDVPDKDSAKLFTLDGAIAYLTR
jgi:acyl carrier protein